MTVWNQYTTIQIKNLQSELTTVHTSIFLSNVSQGTQQLERQPCRFTALAPSPRTSPFTTSQGLNCSKVSRIELLAEATNISKTRTLSISSRPFPKAAAMSKGKTEGWQCPYKRCLLEGTVTWDSRIKIQTQGSCPGKRCVMFMTLSTTTAQWAPWT